MIKLIGLNIRFQQPFQILHHTLTVCPLLFRWENCECSWRITWCPPISLQSRGTVDGRWRICWIPNVHILLFFILISPLQQKQPNYAPLHWIFQSICTFLCSYVYRPTNGQTDTWMVKASFSRYIAKKNTDLSLSFFRPDFIASLQARCSLFCSRAFMHQK